MLRYGIVSQHNGKLHFVHRSFAEFFVAQMFLEALDKEKIRESIFGKKNILIQIFVSPPSETIRTFIDSALSTEMIYQKITKQSLKALGSFLISEFKSIEEKSPLKNFMQLILENEKGRVRRASPKYFVFLSHLCLSSLLECEDEKEATKKILLLTWDDEEEPKPFAVALNNDCEFHS
jgi:hypothetical protein